MYVQGKIETNVSSLPLNLETKRFQVPSKARKRPERSELRIVPRFKYGRFLYVVYMWGSTKRMDDILR